MTINTLRQRYRPTTWPREEMAIQAVNGQHNRIMCPPYYVNRSHPLVRGLVSWWVCLPGLDGGKYFYDIMGFNHGTLTSSPTWAGTKNRPGGYGSLLFNGTSSYVDTFNFADNPSNLTIGFWGKWTSTVNNLDGMTFLSKMTTPATGAGWLLAQLSSSSTRANGLYLMLQESGGTHWSQYETTTTWNNGAWHFIVATVTGGPGNGATLAIYADGKAQSLTANTSGTFTTITNSNSVRLGNNSSGSTGNFFNGSMDSAFVMLRTLSATEIFELYNQTRCGSSDILRQYR